MTETLRIGTRGSPLARFQAELVGGLLERAHPGLVVDYDIIRTTGDAIQHRTLADIGGKGLFAKEIEAALLERRIDLAVHSMKDMETVLPAGLCIAAILPREDPRDALLSERGTSLAALPPGARVGTASVRRQAQILHRRPDLRVVPFRGNVETRIGKLKAGEADATLLALAGLKRLGKEDAVTAVLDTDELLPAAAQGAIGVEIREDDQAVTDMLAAINDPASAICVSVERAMLGALDGSCQTPIGALAVLDSSGDSVTLQGLVAHPDGSVLHRLARTASAAEAVTMGAALGAALRSKMGEDFFR